MNNFCMHYCLVRGMDNVSNVETDSQCLGIYTSLGKLKDAYIMAVQKLEEQHKNMVGLIEDKAEYIVNHEKIMINAFDEISSRWFYDIRPEKLLWNENVEYGHKVIKCTMSSPRLKKWRLDKVRMGPYGYVYDKMMLIGKEETLDVHFDLEYTYQVFELLGSYWGGGDFPDSQLMLQIAKQWYDKYDAELVSFSHDTLSFCCCKLLEEEARNIIEDAKKLHAEIIDCDQESLIEYLVRESKFTLWWTKINT